MKNYVSMILFLCLPLCISCYGDGFDSHYDFPSSKKDINFEGKSLNEVKQAMQGVWYLSDESGELSTEHHLDFYVITIKDDKISITPDPAVGLVASPPRMYDIMWAEDEVKGMNGKMHSFFPRYDGIELMNWTPYIPFEIKNTILKLGSTSGSEGTIYYYKYMCTKK